MKKIAFVLLIMCIALTACQPQEDPPNNNNGDPPEPVILQGYNLAELGLELDTERLRIFEDPEYELTNTYHFVHPDVDQKLAGTSLLIIGYWGGTEVLMYLQGFKKSAEVSSEQYIVVDSEQYTLAELGEYKLFEDDEVVVYDITDLMPGESFVHMVQRWIDAGHSFQWLLDAYEYARSYEDIVITRVNN